MVLLISYMYVCVCICEFSIQTVAHTTKKYRLPPSRTGSHDLSINDEKLSHDPEERKLYYYREDSMYHVFHRLLHMLQQDHPRRHELFWYAHQQMMRR